VFGLVKWSYTAFSISMDIPLEASSLTKGAFCKLLIIDDLCFCLIHAERSRNGSDSFNGNGVYFSLFSSMSMRPRPFFFFLSFLSVFALFVFYGGNCSAEIDLRVLIGGAYCRYLSGWHLRYQVSLTILYCGGIILSLHANDVSVVRISGEYLLTIPMQKGCSDNGAGNEN
jgi:hypothetical protein